MARSKERTKEFGEVNLFGHKFAIATTPDGEGFLLMDEKFAGAESAAAGFRVPETVFSKFMMVLGKGSGNPLRFPDAMLAKLQLVCLAGYAGTLAKTNPNA